MNPRVGRRIAGLLTLATAFLMFLHGSAGQAPRPESVKTPPRLAPVEPKFTPKFEAVAETRLLMEGLAQANFNGLQRSLKQKPADEESWVFARGQALLVAETGNLLLLRPPRNQGRDTWMKLAMDLRSAASTLAQKAGSRDYPGSLAALKGLAGACNQCHQTFRIGVPVGGKPARDADTEE